LNFQRREKINAQYNILILRDLLGEAARDDGDEELVRRLPQACVCGE